MGKIRSDWGRKQPKTCFWVSVVGGKEILQRSLYAGLGNIRQAKFWWNKAILELNDGDAALDYAKFLINRKNKRDYHKIIELLKFATKSDYITEISKEEAGQLLKNLEST